MIASAKPARSKRRRRPPRADRSRRTTARRIAGNPRPVRAWTQIAGKRIAAAIGRVYYDAAASGNNNQHWTAATLVDANTAIAGSIEALRNRCRYEVANNPNVRGIVESFVADVVGTGPRLQIATDAPKFNKSLEDRFSAWTGDGETLAQPACDLTNKDTYSGILRLCIRQLCALGEAFILLQDRPNTPTDQISLRILNVEADRVATPWNQTEGQKGRNGGKVVQGIEQDEYGAPIAYYILKDHPGNSLYSTGFGEYDIIPAGRVIHLARADRAAQARGNPWLTPSLPIFAMLRDFENATLTAALTAASLNAVLETDTVNPDDENDTIEELDEFELPRDAIMSMPAGWRAKQLQAEHPSGTFKDFRAEMINAGGRPLCMPSNVARGNSSNYNYASGRLDHLSYQQSIKVLRKWIDRIMGRTVVRAFLLEAVMIPGFLKNQASGLAYGTDGIKATWFWPGYKHMDPAKEAIGQERRWKNGFTTMSREWGDLGEDWETQIEQRAREQAKLRELGLEEDPNRPDFENYTRAVRAGMPVGLAEARAAMGLPEQIPEGPRLRFNDQDVLQYHIENGIITINEVREVLGLGPRDWGDQPVRKNTVTPVVVDQETDQGGPDSDSTDAETAEEPAI